ncbi:MAG: VOC family protein [Gammaproteobacteria bacterium]|nr:VOC family protein [Gammaproteobacteria bacterium]
MNQNNQINYLEFPSTDLDKSRAFFSELFAWSFNDYGNDYTSFSGAGLKGGFYRSETVTGSSAPLAVIYNSNLEEILEKVSRAGGVITKPIFAFPGGRRFQFTEPGGNELGVWSE